MSVAAYPLAWPDGWPRTPPAKRGDARFGKRSPQGYFGALPMKAALDRLDDELQALGASYITLSSNLERRLDSSPRLNQGEPNDPGVAVYFRRRDRDQVLACDRWNRLADNIAAIAAHIGALRGMDRWGVGTAEQAFAGYVALPASAHAAMAETWWHVLGLNPHASTADIEAAYRTLARAAHPDAGGSDAAMSRLNAARDAALAARSPK